MAAGGLLDILQQTGIRFVEMPGLDRSAAATSFKEAGASRFYVDLLVPSSDENFTIRPVPELKAHATVLPYLTYSLGTSQNGVLLSRHGAAPVRVPDANRFAVHKLLVSQLRTNDSTKSLKDLKQAAVVIGFLGEHHPALSRVRAKRSQRAHAVASSVRLRRPKGCLKRIRQRLTKCERRSRISAASMWRRVEKLTLLMSKYIAILRMWNRSIFRIVLAGRRPIPGEPPCVRRCDGLSDRVTRAFDYQISLGTARTGVA
ncbi:nucleotidyltransferase domain-containing protein [Paraburkholderia caribensis]|nr:nucleotidyltransferase domain-containing protein [Paraburkholderia caribensis]